MAKGLIPRAHFVLWLALNNRLSTVHRIRKWGIQASPDCVLCLSNVEKTHLHLFFWVSIFQMYLETLLAWMGITRQTGSWNEEVNWLSSQIRSSKATTMILGFLFGAAVYTIQNERNSRRFQQLTKGPPDRIKRQSYTQILRDRGRGNGLAYQSLDSFPC